MRTGADLLMTEEGWRKLREDLLSLKEQRADRMDAYLDVKHTLQPDEAVDYFQAEIAPLDRRIEELQGVLSRSLVVGDAEMVPGTAGVCSRVRVRWESGREACYTIVGPPEVDLRRGRISYESPVGRGLVGKRTGDWVDVPTPDGTRRLQVLAVE